MAALAGSSEFAQPKSVAWNAVVRDWVLRGAGWWRCKASKTARLKPGAQLYWRCGRGRFGTGGGGGSDRLGPCGCRCRRFGGRLRNLIGLMMSGARGL